MTRHGHIQHIQGRRLSLLLVLLVVASFGSIRLVYAETCSQHSVPWWPQPNYSYNDSFVSLLGKSWSCWEGENYHHKGYSYGAQWPGNPLRKIRTTVDSWEEINGQICSQHWTADTGWLYGQFSATANTPMHHWVCTGTQSHDYVQLTIHYFGSDSNTATTGTR